MGFLRSEPKYAKRNMHELTCTYELADQAKDHQAHARKKNVDKHMQYLCGLP